MPDHAETLAPAPYVLTAADRCDQCGSRAYGRATINAAYSDLNFCRHHYFKHLEKLREVAIDLLDETEALNVRLSASPE